MCRVGCINIVRAWGPQTTPENFTIHSEIYFYKVSVNMTKTHYLNIQPRPVKS